MKIIFDRTAGLNETSVLTNFSKKHEIPADTTVEELVRRFISQHLRLKGIPEGAARWRLIAVADMEWREVAWINDLRPLYINHGEEPLRDFLGTREPVTFMAIFLRPEEAISLRTTGGTGDRPWIKLSLPIRIDTRRRQILGILNGILSLFFVGLLIYQYNDQRLIFAEAVVAAIASALIFYFLLLKSRRILFSSKSLLYRNNRSQYEKFTVDQFEYLDWNNHSTSFRFVFRFEEKGRNFISAETRDFLQLIIWSVSNGIPIYTTDSPRQNH